MSDFHKFKYSCRTCPIRQQCIDDRGLSPGAKIAIHHTFENRRDTFDTWNILQQDCLLIRREQKRDEPQTRPTTGLLKRLQQMQQPDSPEPASPTPRPVRQSKKQAIYAAAPAEEIPCALTALLTKRVIRLPERGQVVLGRFEYGFARPPDVDLAFDDGIVSSISRRHALIIAQESKHWIEDMGSTNGTYVNARRLTLGTSIELSPGSRILLGRCRLLYEPMPMWMLKPDPNTPHVCKLLVTQNGFTINLADQSQVMVGRSDPNLDYTPDIDLRDAGDVGQYVSRRHIRLHTRNGRHLLEEVGSASGTRLNGRTVEVGAPPVLLQPGDQIWLGGCVVAYQWELLQEGDN